MQCSIITPREARLAEQILQSFFDQVGRMITAFNFSGTWTAENNSAGVLPPRQVSRLLFRGVDSGARLWVDNLVVPESGVSIL